MPAAQRPAPHPQAGGGGAPADPQGRLDFGQAPLDPDSYIEAEENARAVQAIRDWGDWPGGAFAIIGEEGAGKSHLLSAWAAGCGASLAHGNALSADVALASVRLAVDDAEAADESALYAAITRLERDGGALLLSARNPPGLWHVRMPELASRLSAMAWVEVQPPGPRLLSALLRRQAAARGFHLGEDAAMWLGRRLPRSFPVVAQVVGLFLSAPEAHTGSGMALARWALYALSLNDVSDTETAEDKP